MIHSEEKDMKIIKLSADIGNNAQKLFFDNDLLAQPSIVKQLPQKVNVTSDDLEECMGKLMDELHVQIRSTGLSDTGFFFVGKRALNKAQNIDMKAGGAKARNDIPLIMTLSMAAAKHLKNYYSRNKKVPENLKLNAVLASAIPADEYSIDAARHLEKRFNGEHIVTIYVADQECNVIINILKSKVTVEGAPAHLAILNDEEVKKHLPDVDLTDKKVLLADIGDYTSELVVMKGKVPDFDNCRGLRNGIGYALEDASATLAAGTSRPGSIAIEFNRQQIAEIVLDKDHRLYSDVYQPFEKAKRKQATQIAGHTNQHLQRIGLDTEALIVFGGGSIALEEELKGEYEALCNALRIELVWIPKQIAVSLNARGLKQIATLLYNAVLKELEAAKEEVK